MRTRREPTGATMRWRRDLRWNASERSWRIAALFMAGSAIFAIGSFPWYAQSVHPAVVGATFVVGGVVFTAAAAASVVEVIDDDSDRPRRRVLQPGRTAWWAAVVQLVGTLFFNVSTVDAMLDGLSTEQTNRLVWAPDLFGSTCFLIASHLGWRMVCRRRWCVRREDSDWWAAVLNYVGSICFMVAAIAAFTLRTTDEELNTTLVNSGTFAGAVCFLVGAYVLLPPATTNDARPTHSTRRSP